MGGLFSSGDKSHTPAKVVQPPQISAHDQAVLKLKGQRDRLKQYQRKLETTIERDRNSAKEFGKKGAKEKALAILKRNKYRTKLLNNAGLQLDNIETLTNSLEFQVVQNKVNDSMKAGNNALSLLMKEMSVDDVADLMADTRENIEKAEEISRLLSGEGMLDAAETDAVESSLDEMMQEWASVAQQELLAALPEIPITPVRIGLPEPIEMANEPVSHASQRVLIPA